MKKILFLIVLIICGNLVNASSFTNLQNQIAQFEFHYGIHSGNDTADIPNIICIDLETGATTTCTVPILISFYLAKFFNLIWPLAIFLASLMLLYAGILYITKPNDIGKAHKMLLWSLVGLVVAILSFAIVKGLENFILGFDIYEFRFWY